jgi:hypothetical protein
MEKRIEFDPESLKNDERHFEEMEKLLAEGWRFKGNFFDKDQTYRLVLEKAGEGERIFHTTRPFPKVVDITGEIKNIP